MKSHYLKSTLLSFLLVLIAFAITGVSQSPTQIRQKCPNTSVYASVYISGLGAENATPCVNRDFTVTTTGTGKINLSGAVVYSSTVSLANGTAAAPSLNFTNSTTTGLYRSAADTLGLATAGVMRSTFAASDIILNATRATMGDTAVTANGTFFRATDSTKTFSFATTDNLAIVDAAAVNKFQLQRTITAGGTTGAQTINKPAGTVNIAAGAASVAITNNTVTTTSIPVITLRTADGTCTFVKSAVSTANTLTITLNANCTAETSVGFIVYN